METKSGTIVMLGTKGKYGFIQPDNGGKQIFFHQSGLVSPRNFSELREGLPVEYLNTEDMKHRPRAIGVVVV